MEEPDGRPTVDLTTRYDGPWREAEVRSFLEESRLPMRLATNTPSGFPVIVSVWYLHEDEGLHAAVHESSKIAKRLREDPRCAVEIAPNEPPYFGVRMRCLAELTRDEDGTLLRRLLTRYLGTTETPLATWLLSRASGELHVRLRPITISSWDYRERMAGASSDRT